jgi:hypothetical protein
VLKTPSDIYELGQTLLTNMRWISDFSAEEFGDTNGLIIIRKTKKDRQHNGQKEHKIARKTKDRVKRTPLTTGAELMCSRNVSSLQTPLQKNRKSISYLSIRSGLIHKYQMEFSTQI